ncbi:SPOR domain-containing protein [Candidatus Fermentibacterales bacterium]|nr:SPOR domain-containing protein [Candidatus Fermentibacterales bacterium]
MSERLMRSRGSPSRTCGPAVHDIAVMCSVLCLAVASCGTPETIPDSGAGTGEIDPYSDGPLELPDAYGQDPFAGFGPVTRIDVPGEPSLPPPGDPDPGPGPSAGSGELPGIVRDGYSIQIAACDTRDGAERMAALTADQTGEPIYVDSLPPYWKVRIGCFGTRQEAEAFLPEVRSMGYSDAWVVERVLDEGEDVGP